MTAVPSTNPAVPSDLTAFSVPVDLRPIGQTLCVLVSNQIPNPVAFGGGGDHKARCIGIADGVNREAQRA